MEPTLESREIVRRIYTRLAWLDWTLDDLAMVIGSSKSVLGTYMSLSPRQQDPLKWGSRGGKVTLGRIADAMHVPVEALHAGGPAGPLVGPREG